MILLKHKILLSFLIVVVIPFCMISLPPSANCLWNYISNIGQQQKGKTPFFFLLNSLQDMKGNVCSEKDRLTFSKFPFFLTY